MRPGSIASLPGRDRAGASTLVTSGAVVSHRGGLSVSLVDRMARRRRHSDRGRFIHEDRRHRRHRAHRLEARRPAREHGHEAVAASPNSGVNTLTGEGLADVWRARPSSSTCRTRRRSRTPRCSSSSRRRPATCSPPRPPPASDTTSRCPSSAPTACPDSGYLRAKVAQEQLITSSPIPYSIVRATQFFEFVPGIADAATEGDTVRVPTALIQPMAADDVAAAVGEVAVGVALNGDPRDRRPRAVAVRRVRARRPQRP